MLHKQIVFFIFGKKKQHFYINILMQKKENNVPKNWLHFHLGFFVVVCMS